MSAESQPFNAEWLADRLTGLVPGYPAVSLCVALSGGVDSTVLLAALAQLKRARGKSSRKAAGVRASRAGGARTASADGPGLRAIHVDHGLHPHAKRWSAHCRALAAGLSVPLSVLKVKVNRSRGTSLEAEARRARYALLERELRQGEILLTGHHEDDQLETVLLQLFRGAGLGGLAAMPPLARFAQGWLARPLLPVSRASLEAYARAHKLAWVEDDTNLDERFDRNYLRRTVLPLVTARWPAAGRAVSRSARHVAEAQRLLNALALADVERAAAGAALSAKVLRRLSPERRRNALRYWIAQQGATQPNTSRLEELAGPVLDARAEASPKVAWGSTSVQRQGGLLILRSVPSR